MYEMFHYMKASTAGKSAASGFDNWRFHTTLKGLISVTFLSFYMQVATMRPFFAKNARHLLV